MFPVSNYTNEQAAQIALIENTCREALNPIAEAIAMQRLAEEFRYTHDEISMLLGVSRPHVSNLLRLLRMDGRVQHWVKQGHLSEGVMDIKKLVSISIVILCPFLSNAYAGQSNDSCSKIPGHWQGIYTIKDQDTCKLYNGCTHLVMADVSYISNNEYHLNLNPSVGEGGKFNIKCDSGVISSPIPGSKATISCNALNQCYVIYDDPRLTSEMMKS